jgi:Family of unknown function (DUF5706)
MVALDPEQLRVARLERLRSGAASWIGSADGKAMAVLTVGGALLALLAAVLAGVTAASTTALTPSKCERALFVTFCVANLVSIALSAWALFPRTNRAAILEKARWKTPLPHSRSFFADLAKLSPDEFTTMVSSQDVEPDQQDAMEQAFVLQHIARAKMCSIRLSISALVLGLAALTGLLIVAVV